MKVHYIGIAKIIDKYRNTANHAGGFNYTWFRLMGINKVVYGSDSIGEFDLMVKTEEQFDQAITLVLLGFTDKETLQQLLGI